MPRGRSKKRKTLSDLLEELEVEHERHKKSCDEITKAIDELMGFSFGE